jgi:hypothetical protein
LRRRLRHSSEFQRRDFNRKYKAAKLLSSTACLFDAPPNQQLPAGTFAAAVRSVTTEQTGGFTLTTICALAVGAKAKVANKVAPAKSRLRIANL